MFTLVWALSEWVWTLVNIFKIGWDWIDLVHTKSTIWNIPSALCIFFFQFHYIPKKTQTNVIVGHSVGYGTQANSTEKRESKRTKIDFMRHMRKGMCLCVLTYTLTHSKKEENFDSDYPFRRLNTYFNLWIFCRTYKLYSERPFTIFIRIIHNTLAGLFGWKNGLQFAMEFHRHIWKRRWSDALNYNGIRVP